MSALVFTSFTTVSVFIEKQTLVSICLYFVISVGFSYILGTEDIIAILLGT